jgi:isocitrate dehydrogenase
MSKTPITVAYGDGIGPEIMEASLRILQEAGAAFEPEVVTVGEKVYLSGNTSGIEPAFWDSIRRTKVFFKAPLTTPQGGGFKSINVTTRKTLSLFANIRPTRSLHPFVQTKHPKQDILIVRENEEDLYAGIEHRQTPEVFQCLKLISRPGSERLIRYAFEYARANKRKKVTCFTKDNIMKLTDGVFHQIFEEVAAEYPDLENEHWIVDIGAAKMSDTPEAFDVIVLPNLYGDVLSDIAAQIAGSVGLAGSANVGEHAAMFEAIHGSAPRRAGQNLANPSGLLQGGIMMMVHIGQPEIAERVHNAWLRTIEDGVHTYDIFRDGVSREKVGTKEFADAVIARLGQRPETLAPVSYSTSAKVTIGSADSLTVRAKTEQVLRGVDVFLNWDKPGRDPNVLAEGLSPAGQDGLPLCMITSRGLKVWPNGAPETFCVDHWRCRFGGSPEGTPIDPQQIIDLLQRIHNLGYQVIKTENLYTFDGEPGYSLGQGQ